MAHEYQFDDEPLAKLTEARDLCGGDGRLRES
jgi:hypothetical protein